MRSFKTYIIWDIRNAYITYIRQILKCIPCVLNPGFNYFSLSISIEKVQTYFTRRLHYMCTLYKKFIINAFITRQIKTWSGNCLKTPPWLSEYGVIINTLKGELIHLNKIYINQYINQLNTCVKEYTFEFNILQYHTCKTMSNSCHIS